MNQQVVIYIILSAILLYLYYKRGGLALFAAFVVVVAGTLFMGTGTGAREGMKGKVDKECAKLGFTAPNIVKDSDGDVRNSLEKEMKKIKKVADKHWPYDVNGISNDDKGKENMEKFLAVALKIYKEKEWDKKEEELYTAFMDICKSMYSDVNNPDESKRRKIQFNPSELADPAGYINMFVEPVNKLLNVLETTKKSSKLKDNGSKKIAEYLTCLCKQWLAIFNAIKNTVTTTKGESGKKKKSKKDDVDDDDNDDEDEDSGKKKKKKKTTKKKKSDNDDVDDDDE